MSLFHGSSAKPAQALQSVPGISDVVWSTLARLDGTRKRHRLVFVSAERRAGTTTLAAATAIGLLQHRRVPVCLIETNVAHPALAGYLGLKPRGLTDVLAGRARLDECLQEPEGCKGLHVLPAGTPRRPIPGEFTTEAFRAIVEGLGGLSNYLVLDAPPLLDHLESRLLLRGSDGALLVVRTGRTRKADIERASSILAESAAPVLGAIFNAYAPAGIFDDKLAQPTAEPASSPELSPDYAWVEPAAQPAPPAEDEHARPRAFDEGALLLLAGSVPEDVHKRQIALLERRIAKLTRHLAKAEENLARMAELRGEDEGLASIYRTVQGLSPEERALAFKQKLMEKIYQANLELKRTLSHQQT